ncbi:acyl-homoserine-lactone synthase [Ramlibacter sp.]|uniref:acyl-homoserine-lactone synthase n=1 Tax=Ramlibacter sp. TaxID=1917967 RepID=UPI0035B1F45C
MSHTIQTHSLRDMAAQDRLGMFRLRAEVFSQRLGWDVQLTDDGLEIDPFDQVDTARYIIARDPLGRVDACWRLLPTLGPNMLRDVFPELLHGQPAPAAADVWELSRFAVAAERVGASDSAGTHQIGFGELSVALMAQSTRFAQAHGIARYVTVTTAAIERMLRKQGVNVHRLGPPLRIGQVLTVACFIEIDDITLRALGR